LAEGDEVVEAGIEQAENIEALQQALAEEKEKAEKYFANWQRSQANFENYMKRAELEKSEVVESANRGLIFSLLPILDDFEIALASPPAGADQQNWTEGVRLIYNKLKSTLESQGLTEIKAEGERFDPYYHEGVGEVEGEEGMVIKQLRKGYKFKDKLLRPSMVMVGKGKDSKTQEQTSESKEM